MTRAGLCICDAVKSSSTGLSIAPLHCVMCQLSKNPMGQLRFCLSASGVQLAVLHEVHLQLLITERGFGDVPAAEQNNVGGILLFKTVGYHRELFFGKAFICDELSLNPGQILQSINCSYMKN